MKSIAVKYCGGCNPHFDRVRLVESILGGLPGLESASYDGAPVDFALIVNGCSRSCASGFEMQNRHGKFVVSSFDEGEAVKIELRKNL